MANDKSFKVKNGLSAKRYLQSGSALAASDVDVSSGSYFTKTLSANTTFTFSNPPASGSAGSFALEVTGADVTVGYDLANAAYDSVSFSVGSQSSVPTSIYIKPDGSGFYILGDTNDRIYQYSMSTAWDISSSSYDSKNLLIGLQENQGKGMFFKDDGTKMYIVGSSGDSVESWTLSTAWDISTGSYDSVAFSTLAQDNDNKGLFFKPDGTKMYLCGRVSTKIHEYNLSTAWDISTASFNQSSNSFSAYETTPEALSISPDGNTLYLLGSGNDKVYEFSLSSSHDISSLTFVQDFSIASQETTPQGMFFKDDGSKMYVVGYGNDTIYQYTTEASTPATITYPSSVKWSGATTPDAPAGGEKDVYTFVTTDGGTTYYGKQAGDAVA